MWHVCHASLVDTRLACRGFRAWGGEERGWGGSEPVAGFGPRVGSGSAGLGALDDHVDLGKEAEQASVLQLLGQLRVTCIHLLVCVVRLRPVFRPVIVGCPFSQSSASGSGVWFTCFACLLLHSACGDAQTRHACAGKQDTTRHTKRHTRGSLIQTCSSRRPVMGAHAVKMVPAEANAPQRQCGSNVALSKAPHPA